MNTNLHKSNKIWTILELDLLFNFVIYKQEPLTAAPTVSPVPWYEFLFLVLFIVEIALRLKLSVSHLDERSQTLS